MTASAHANFRQRLLAKEKLIGTFLKTPSPIICEVLGLTPLDAVCIDAEHAPFDRLVLDSCIQALRAAGMPSLVRVPSAAPEQILNALDCGATGIVVPHVTSAKQAEGIAKAARFGPGGRGYAGSTRAAVYTTKPMAEHKADSEKETTVIAFVEDIEAVDAIAEIAAVEGIDCLFVGRIDLTVAYGAESPNDPRVVAAVEKICQLGSKAGKTVGMFVANVDEVSVWQEQGANLFLLTSDHGFILSGARELVARFRG